MNVPWEISPDSEDGTSGYMPTTADEDAVRGSKRFYIHNITDSPLTATVDVSPDERTPSQWFTLDKVQLEIPGGETKSAQVDVELQPANFTSLHRVDVGPLGDKAAIPIELHLFEWHSFEVRVRSFGQPETFSEPVKFRRPLPGNWRTKSWPEYWLDLSQGDREVTFTLNCPGLHVPSSLRFEIEGLDEQSAPWFRIERPIHEIVDTSVTPMETDYQPHVAQWKVIVDADAALATQEFNWMTIYPKISIQPGPVDLSAFDGLADLIPALEEPPSERPWTTLMHWESFGVYRRYGIWEVTG